MMRSLDATSINGGAAPGGHRAKRSKWLLLVLALLLGHAAILAFVAVVATRDPSFAVMPNYYAQAVAWDATQAEKRASDKLGWKLTIVPADEIDALGHRRVQFSLADATGTAIAGAKIEVTGFHHSHANDLSHFTLMTDTGGIGTQVLVIRHAGFWDFQCEALGADGRKYMQTITQYIDPPRRLSGRTLQ